MRSRVKGQALTIEALVIGLASLLIIAFALRYVTSLIVTPTLTQGRVEARLCGNVMLITNVGKTTVTIDSAMGYSQTSGVTNSFLHFINPRTLQPGQTVKVIIPTSYPLDYASISGRDFPSIVVKNECRG